MQQFAIPKRHLSVGAPATEERRKTAETRFAGLMMSSFEQMRARRSDTGPRNRLPVH